MTATGGWPLLLAAGVVAGVVGTAGGITSLISYPALLAAGVPALAADVANMVAIVACWPGSALASRPELVGRTTWLGRWLWLGAAGGVAGALLLLVTPSHTFDRVVPFLVAAASLALWLQPRLAAAVGGRARGHRSLLAGGLLSISVYNGYFGAGAGVMTLVLLLLTVGDHVARANALKNMLLGAATLAAASVFVVRSPVDWAAVAPLGVGLAVGSMIGPHLARRLPAPLLRRAVALIGLALAVWLWRAPG